MLTNLQTRLKAASRWLPVALLPLLPLAASAQNLGYGAATAVNTTTTYTDLGTTGTAISTSSTDDANSAAQSIGFTFTYNGTAFTQFILNTNGLIKLGSTAPSTAALYFENFAGGSGIDPLGSSAGAADINVIMPFNFDLVQGTAAAEYRVATTGTAPNRVCTIQWKNVSDKAEAARAGSQYANFSFQAKLYEGGNIEFVYGAATASAATAATRFPNVGLKGSNTNTNQVALALKGVPGALWSTTTFISQNYGLLGHTINKVGLPDLGRTYRFVPSAVTAPANDNCAGATALTVGFTCTNVTANNGTATASTGAPALTAAGCFNPVLAIDNDLWYTVVVPATGTVTVTTSASAGSTVDDTGIIIYSGTCAALTEIGCNDAIAAPNNEFSSATVTGRTPGSTLYVRVFTYPGTPAGAFGICATSPVPNDAAARMVYTLTKLPIPQGAPHAVSAYITNTGTTAQVNLVVTLNVTGANTFNNTQTVASLAPGASTTVTFAPYVPTAAGTNTVTVSLPADDNTGNNTASVTQVVNASDYSYADATPPLRRVALAPAPLRPMPSWLSSRPTRR
jgi:hypothetical protein